MLCLYQRLYYFQILGTGGSLRLGLLGLLELDLELLDPVLLLLGAPLLLELLVPGGQGLEGRRLEVALLLQQLSTKVRKVSQYPTRALLKAPTTALTLMNL